MFGDDGSHLPNVSFVLHGPRAGVDVAGIVVQVGWVLALDLHEVGVIVEAGVVYRNAAGNEVAFYCSQRSGEWRHGVCMTPNPP